MLIPEVHDPFSVRARAYCGSTSALRRPAQCGWWYGRKIGTPHLANTEEGEDRRLVSEPAQAPGGRRAQALRPCR